MIPTWEGTCPQCKQVVTGATLFGPGGLKDCPICKVPLVSMGLTTEAAAEIGRVQADLSARRVEGKRPRQTCIACGSDRPDVCQLMGHSYP